MGEEVARKFEMVDYVFSGPALSSFPKFVKCYLAGDSTGTQNIDGVFTKDNLKKIWYGKNRTLKPKESILPLGEEINLDNHLPLDYDDFLAVRSRYPQDKIPEPGLFFETSRGCWWGERAHCTFCGLNSVTMGYRSAGQHAAVKQISSLIEKYGDIVDYYACVDNIMPKNYPDDVFSKLNLQKPVEIFYQIKPDFSYEELRTLKENGVTSMLAGIEAFDNSVLKLMRKGVTSSQNIRFLKDATRVGINLLWSLLVGFPGETEKPYYQLSRVIPQIIHLHPPDLLGGLSFARYSPYFDFQEKFGLQLEPVGGYQYLYPVEEGINLDKLAYFFQDSTADPQYAVFRKKWYLIIHKQLQKWRNRWFFDDGLPNPQLYFRFETRDVYDSRTGEEVIHSLPDLAFNMLQYLNKPTSIGKLINQFKESSENGFHEILGELIEKGLVFHDQKTSFISLVLDEPVSLENPLSEFSFY